MFKRIARFVKHKYMFNRYRLLYILACRRANRCPDWNTEKFKCSVRDMDRYNSLMIAEHYDYLSKINREERP